jgi:hypothetical protein
MSSEQQVYTPAFQRGVRIPTGTLLRRGAGNNRGTPFRPQRELIYNYATFAQVWEPRLVLGWESVSFLHFVFPLACAHR